MFSASGPSTGGDSVFHSKMTFSLFGIYLHKWKGNGKKIHNPKFQVTGIISVKLVRRYTLILLFLWGMKNRKGISIQFFLYVGSTTSHKLN